MIRVTRTRRAVTAVAIALLAVLAGCSWYPDPPDDVVVEAEHYLDAVRLIDGVAKATVTVDSRDPIHDANTWVARVIVDARSAEDLAVLPGLLAAVDPPTLSQLVVVARFPATETLAPVVLHVGPGLAAPAEALRALPFVDNVYFDGDYNVATLRPGIDFAAAVARIRELSPWGELTSLTVSNPAIDSSVEFSATAPSPELLGVLDVLSLDRSVEHLSLGFGDAGTPRNLSIDTSDPARIAADLDTVTPVDGTMLRYHVHSDEHEFTGCVGGGSC